MKKRTLLLITCFAALCFSAAPALADIYPTAPVVFGPGTAGEDSLQTVFNKMTIAPTLGLSQVITTTDAITDLVDSYWEPTAGGGAFATMIIEITAGASTQTFGMFDASNPATKAQIFAGGDSPGTTGKATITFFTTGVIQVHTVLGGDVFSAPFAVDADGAPTFGWYLSNWYSDTFKC